MRSAGVAIDESLEVTGHATADLGFLAAQTLLDLPEPPTAIFCANDRMAMGAYDAIKERGLRIPHDVAVIGFDNQEVIAAYKAQSAAMTAKLADIPTALAADRAAAEQKLEELKAATAPVADIQAAEKALASLGVGADLGALSELLGQGNLDGTIFYIVHWPAAD